MKNKKRLEKCVYQVIMLVGMILAFSCEKKEAPETKPAAEAVAAPAAQEDTLPWLPTAEEIEALHSAQFAAYTNYQRKEKAQVPSYTIAAGLSNIVNLSQFTADGDYWWRASILSDEAKSMIERNGFAVDDGESRTEFFGVYEANRYNHVPSFITTDSAIHTFHLMFDYVLKNLEQEKLAAALQRLSRLMVQASLSQYEALKGSDFENAAKRNAAFFSVGASLLNSSFAVSTLVASDVQKELALINAAGGIAVSPILNMGETFNNPIEYQQMDYSQFIPRGHYTVTDKLKAYFKAQMWFGLAAFRSGYEDEVKSAVLQTAALKDKEVQSLWYMLFAPTTFFVGECDDSTFNQYNAALSEVYGAGLSDIAALTDKAKFAAALKTIQALPPPRINTIPVYTEEIQSDRDKASTGYRFLGQRFTIDAALFQRLMDRETKDRMLPKALDLPAALGSTDAVRILQDEGEMDKYPTYANNLQKIHTHIKTIGTDTWTSNLYWSWLYMLRPLAENVDKTGLPLFMQNTAWDLKSLNTFLGSWTELKHDTILYAKEPIAEKGGDGPEPPYPDDRGYVEPNPLVFARLASLVDMTINGLQSRNLLTAEAKEALGVLLTIARQLTIIAEKELSGAALSDAEYESIRNYGGELEHIWTTAKADELNGSGEDDWDWDYPIHDYLREHPGAIIADIATDPNGWVLEEATGYAKEIYAAFPRDSEVVLGRGVVYSQYEFTVPMSERMTNEAWHERLRSGETPDLANWKRAFTVNIGQSKWANYND